MRTPEEAEYQAREGVLCLWQDPVTFTEEYLLCICDGEVLSGSAYRVGEWMWGDDVERDVAPPAEALEVGAKVALAMPGAYTVDVGRTADGRWLVVEGNPAWLVLRVLRRRQGRYPALCYPPRDSGAR